MRPLYIDGHRETWVDLEDPALKISVPDQADQLFPLQRISRVIVSGGVQWHTDALLACANQGITVTFLDENGDVIARWLGKSLERQRFLQRLSDLISRADGQELYDSWYQGMERMVVQSAAKSLLKQSHRVVTADELQAFLNEQQQNLTIQPVKAVYDSIGGLVFAQVVQLFHENGLNAESELLHEQWLDLPRDFAKLLLWDLQIPLLIWLESSTVIPNFRKRVEFYDARSTRISRLCQGLTNKLHRWLVELY